MLTINLLPEDQRKTTLSRVEQFHRTPLMWIGLGALFALPLMVLAPVQLNRQKLQQLNAKLQVLEPKKFELDQLQKFLQQLHAQQDAFQDLGKKRGRWAERLNVLSDLTPEGVWYTELNLDPNSGLVIQGAAIEQGREPSMVRVTRLVQGLKATKAFEDAVKDIQIESIKRVQEGEVEVMQFTLTFALKTPSS